MTTLYCAPDDPLYPLNLRRNGTQQGVWYEGKIDAPFYVGIVGARDATDGAIAFAKELARGVCRAGGCVVSGGAIGIDRAAHDAALEVGGHTIAVLGTGRNKPYPRAHASLFDRIVESSGGLLWYVPPDRAYVPGCLPQRNRLLASLCDAVVAVQATGETCGTMSAAEAALAVGRPLYAMCVSPWEDDDAYKGNRLLLERQHAIPLATSGRVLQDLGRGSGQQALLFPPAPRPLPEHLQESEKTVALALDGEPRHLDDVCERAGLPPQVVSTALLTLALEDVVVEGPGGFYRRA